MNHFKISVSPISQEAIRHGEKPFVIYAEGFSLGAQEDITNKRPNTLLNEKPMQNGDKTRMHAYCKGYGGVESLLYVIDNLPQDALETLALAILVKRGMLKTGGHEGEKINPSAIVVLAEKMKKQY